VTENPYPPHLRPVPDGGATAPALEPQSGIPGLTPPATAGGSNRFITDVLEELGYVGSEQVVQAIEAARNAGKSPEALLLERQVITPDQLSRAIAERFGLNHLDLTEFNVDMGAASLLPAGTAKHYRAIPVGYVDEGTLLVAMADPVNVLAVDDIQMITGHDVQVAVATPQDIEDLTSRLNTFEATVSEAIEDAGSEHEEQDSGGPTELRASADDAPVIKLVHSILAQAISEGASDIHFEPEDTRMRVRFRVDGVMHEATSIPRRMTSGVVSRLKIMAEMDIAQRRLPQGGRVGLLVEDSPVDLRVTTLPAVNGEGVVLRILDKSNALIDLDQMGMFGETRSRFEASIHRPHGAMFVTGPTGSGKSTTLYAALNALNTPEKHIITIEDPVEYQLEGINQLQVHPKVGMTFATGLRSILRADPDIIMVGEIRDAETARIAVESALTGHLVLSTLHTNNAPTAITRLTEMGIEPFLTASALDCVIAQRLARRLCPSCKRRVLLPVSALAESGFRVGAEIEAYEPGACKRCSGTGYRGRVGIFEAMQVTNEIRTLTIESAPAEEIFSVAREQGMTTLREDGLEKVRSGITSIEEVVRVSS
jgi:type IV pilus assembly protein PilB